MAGVWWLVLGVWRVLFAVLDDAMLPYMYMFHRLALLQFTNILLDRYPSRGIALLVIRSGGSFGELRTMCIYRYRATFLRSGTAATYF